MPLPDDFQVGKPETRDFEVIPTGEYMVLIDDIEDMGESEYQGKKRGRLRFWLKIVKGEHKDSLLAAYITNTWFAGGRFAPSHLFQLACAVYREKLEEAPDLNTLIGGGLKVTVNKVKRQDGEGYYSKVVDYLPFEKEEAAEFKKIAKEIETGFTEKEEKEIEESLSEGE